MDEVGVFTADQVEILSTERLEPDWLRSQRNAAHRHFADTPMPDRRPEEWRYTPIREMLDLGALQLAEGQPAVATVAELPAGLAKLVGEVENEGARIVQVGASVVQR